MDNEQIDELEKLAVHELAPQERQNRSGEPLKAYPYSEIQKLLGYHFEVGRKECGVMTIDRLISYLNAGWVIYDVSGQGDIEIKSLALVMPNQV